MSVKTNNEFNVLGEDISINLPKTAIIGASGFLGSHFLRTYRNIFPDCVGTIQKSVTDDLFTLDLHAPDSRSLCLAQTKHKEAIILAGITKISACETEKELSWKINVEGTLELIRQLVKEGIKPIFTSSDYVFDGESGNYSDSAPTHPITEYGRQKVEVERGIAKISQGNYLVVRLSKIFSLRKGDGTLLDEMAKILASAGTLRVAYDQFFCPTLVSDLVRVIAYLQSHKFTGIINVCSPQAWSRYDIALQMAKAMKLDPDKISRVSLDEIMQGFKCPKNTSMKIERLINETPYSFIPLLECIEWVAENWREK